MESLFVGFHKPVAEEEVVVAEGPVGDEHLLTRRGRARSVRRAQSSQSLLPSTDVNPWEDPNPPFVFEPPILLATIHRVVGWRRLKKIGGRHFQGQLNGKMMITTCCMTWHNSGSARRICQQAGKCHLFRFRDFTGNGRSYVCHVLIKFGTCFFLQTGTLRIFNHSDTSQ